MEEEATEIAAMEGQAVAAMEEVVMALVVGPTEGVAAEATVRTHTDIRSIHCIYFGLS